MALKNNSFTKPKANNYNNCISKDWYVFFQFKYNGKIFKFKRREGINRIKKLRPRITALNKLMKEIESDLRHGWNPILDPKRENIYNSYLNPDVVKQGKMLCVKEDERMLKYL